MNLSYVLSAQPTSFSAITYNESLEDNISKIKGMGYDGVELGVRDPEQIDAVGLKSILHQLNISVPAIGTGQAFLEEGLSFVDDDPDTRRKAIERIKKHIQLADDLNAIVIIGLVRGRKKEGVSDEKTLQWSIEAFRECASENQSVKLAIEPINRYETDIINTVESGLNFIEKVDMKNVGLLLDSFHMNIEEPSITDSIVSAKDRLFHFHIADSNRWYPGAGHMDFGDIVDTLKSVDYQDYVSAEILPVPDPDTAARKTIEHMRRFLD